MKQICNKEYWTGMESMLARGGDPENPGQPCGRTFDDASQRTYCPHPELPPRGPIYGADGSVR